jgi:putative transposase
MMAVRDGPDHGQEGQEMNESSLAHTKWDCTYHIVWIPKYRKRVLYGECRILVRDIIRELVDKKPGLGIVEGSICRDHIHLCLRIPPKYAVANVMGYLKGKSAMMLAERMPEGRKRREREKAFWARGYYVSTVGKDEETIREYIRRQQQDDRSS